MKKTYSIYSIVAITLLFVLSANQAQAQDNLAPDRTTTDSTTPSQPPTGTESGTGETGSSGPGNVVDGVNTGPGTGTSGSGSSTATPGTIESTLGGTLLTPGELDDILDRINKAPELRRSDIGESVAPDASTKSSIQVTELGGRTIDRDITIIRSSTVGAGTAQAEAGVLESSGVFATYSKRLITEGSKLLMETSSGRKQINILPEKALEVSATPNKNLVTTLELKEEPQGPIYSIKGTRPARFLGIFSINLRIETKVSAESGKVLSVKRPWWRFLAW